MGAFTKELREIATWILEHGVGGILIASNILWVWLYFRERESAEKLTALRIDEQKERVMDERANTAVLIKTTKEVSETIKIFTHLIDYMRTTNEGSSGPEELRR